MAVLLAGLGLLRAGQGQEIQLGGDLPANSARRQHVALDGGSVRVRAGAPEWVSVRFQVDSGFHINSHRPHDELLVPTSLELQAGSAVKVVAQRYPEGVPLRLEIGGGETLSTYQGAFQVELRVSAPRGSSVLAGSLQYQACNARACFPPRSLPVQLTVTAE